MTRMAIPLNADPADLAHVERIVRAAGTSFYRGMRILRPDRRAAMYAIYAFCRLVDDIADDPAPLDWRLSQLDLWRGRIAALRYGKADDPVSRVLLAASRRYDLRERDFLAVIDGMQMDADAIVAPDLAQLDLYCDRVAAAVGRLSVRAFGDSSEAADLVAWHLGRALQMTNILRDLGEDCDRGRLYLPREWLTDHHVPMVPDQALRSPNLPSVGRRMAAQAHAHFAQAACAMRRCDRRAMRPARLMAAGYAAILNRLERRGWARLAERVRVPRWQKAWIALRYGIG